MPSDPIQPDRTGLPPFAGPMLRALDRMRQRAPRRPEQLTAHARRLLDERFGTSAQPAEAAFAHGGTGLLGGHTHYFDGFALLMPLQDGAAVAIRRADSSDSRLAFEGSDGCWTMGETSSDFPWVCVVEKAVQRWHLDESGVEVAVVSTVQAGCSDAYLAALGVATARALQALFAFPDATPDLLRAVRAIISESIAAPYSIAYPIAAEAGRPHTYSLIDTATLEHLPVEPLPPDILAWGLVDTGVGLLREPAVYRQRQAQTDEVLSRLQSGPFPDLQSLRDLEHRRLPDALNALPRRLRPIARHLVTENQRVPRLVAALRNHDAQMIGALLLIAHASLKNDWQSTNLRVDFVVEQAERLSLEGLYGAIATGRSGCVLVSGKPFAVPPCLDRIATAFSDRFGNAPDVVLL